MLKARECFGGERKGETPKTGGWPPTFRCGWGCEPLSIKTCKASWEKKKGEKAATQAEGGTTEFPVWPLGKELLKQLESGKPGTVGGKKSR